MRLTLLILFFALFINTSKAMEETNTREETLQTEEANSPTENLQVIKNLCADHAHYNAIAYNLLNNESIPFEERMKLCHNFTLSDEMVKQLIIRKNSNPSEKYIEAYRRKVLKETAQQLFLSTINWGFLSRSFEKYDENTSGEVLGALLGSIKKELLSSVASCDADCRDYHKVVEHLNLPSCTTTNASSHYLAIESYAMRTVFVRFNSMLPPEHQEQGAHQFYGTINQFTGGVLTNKVNLEDYEDIRTDLIKDLAGTENISVTVPKDSYGMQKIFNDDYSNCFIDVLVKASKDPRFFNIAFDEGSKLYKLLTTHTFAIESRESSDFTIKRINGLLNIKKKRPVKNKPPVEKTHAEKEAEVETLLASWGVGSSGKKNSKKRRRRNKKKPAQQKSEEIKTSTLAVGRSPSKSSAKKKQAKPQQQEQEEEQEEQASSGGEIALAAHDEYLRYLTPLQIYKRNGGSNSKTIRELEKLVTQNKKSSKKSSKADKLSELGVKLDELEFYYNNIWGSESARGNLSWNKIVKKMEGFGWVLGNKSGSARSFTPPNWLTEIGFGSFPISIHADHNPNSKPVKWTCIAFLRTGLASHNLGRDFLKEVIDQYNS